MLGQKSMLGGSWLVGQNLGQIVHPSGLDIVPLVPILLDDMFELCVRFPLLVLDAKRIVGDKVD